MPPAARVSDMHTCNSVTGIIPHVGGAIIGPGEPTVLIGGLPAAIVGDEAACNGPADTLVMGSATVMIGGVPAVRVGDETEHGGSILVGEPTVLIGG